MSVNSHHTISVQEVVKGYIRDYLKIDHNQLLMRTGYSELIRDIILKRGILSNNSIYKQERDAILWFLNEDLMPFMHRLRGNASWDIKAEFMIRIAAAVIINYLYVYTPMYCSDKITGNNKRGDILRQMRNAFREYIDNEYLIMNSDAVYIKFHYLQQYEQQVINQTREQFGEEVRKQFGEQYYNRERQSIDQRNSRPKYIDETKVYYPEFVTVSQAEIVHNMLPNLHIDTYDIT